MPYRKILPFVEIMPSILDGITDAFIFIDNNWNFVYMNKHSQVFSPRPIHKLIGKNMLEEFPNLKKTVFYKKYKEAFKTGKVQKFVAEYPSHNKWYDVTVYPSENGLLIYFNDITKQKMAEEKENEHQKLVRMRLRLQEAIASLGQKALSDISIRELFDITVEQLAEILDIEYVKILELLPGGKKLVLRAGIGWRKSVKVDVSTVGTGRDSQAGLALASKKPVITTYLPTDKRFNEPHLLKSHDVVSGMSVIIYGVKNKPWGVLGVHTKNKRIFSNDDVQHLQSVANILSLAIQRHAIESDLKTSEEGFRTISETIPHMVWVARPDGYNEYFNGRWYKFTQKSFNETKGDKWNTLLHPEDRERVWKRWRQSLKTGKPYEVEHRVRNGKTGEYRWVLSRALPVHDEKGKITRWFGTYTDIHEQKHEAEIKEFLAKSSAVLGSSLEYEKTLKSVAKLAVQGISDWCAIDMHENGTVKLVAIAHKDPKQVKWARTLRKQYPVNMSSPTGFPKVLKTQKPEFYPVITDEMIEAVTKNKKELDLVHKVGFKSVMIVPIFVNKEVIGGITFVSTQEGKYFTDADLYMAQELANRAGLAIENVLLYEQAQKNEAQFKALSDANIVGVVHSNVKGTIYSANDAFLSMVGYSQKDLQNKRVHWKKIYSSEYLSKGKEVMNELLTSGSAEPFEAELIRKDGSQIPVIIGSAMVNKKKREMISIVLDITERKKLEQRKDEFIGIASHELKTPLTSIKGYVQILERIISEMGNDKLNLYLKRTNTYVDRLNSLITDLLDMSKIQSGKLQMNYEEFILDDLVKEGIEHMQHTNSHHKITFKGSYKKLIRGDRTRLEQVVTNLLSNAIKYSPNADEVLVEIAGEGEEVRVSVKDKGIGIPEHRIPSLFQRFYRVEETARKFSGLGIGLYLTAEIVHRHGGRIWVESSEGKGSTFHFTLPTKLGKRSN